MYRDESYMMDKRDRGICYFNDGVVCFSRFCHKCGWNPAVCEARKREIRERLAAEARMQSALKKGVNGR